MGARGAGVAMAVAAVIAVGGCERGSAPEEVPSTEPAQPTPPRRVQEYMASLEMRGDTPTRSSTPTYEVTHFVGEYRPLRSLPVLISQTPAPDPRGGRPHYSTGHGVVTTIRPRLKTTTARDGFQWRISWDPSFGGDRVSPATIDLVATLADTRFRFDDGSGEVLELRTSQRDARFGVMELLFAMSSEGLEIQEGLVEPYGPSSSGSLMLPWKGGKRRELERPGRWRVQVAGNLHFFARGPLPYESSWVEFQLEPESSPVLPLADIRTLSKQLLTPQIGPEDSPARYREILGENEAGNRVVVFDRGSSGRQWVQRTSLVELSRSGELVGIWRDERHTCVAEGTMLETSQGTLPIEAVSIGDRVLSFDIDLGRHVWSEVRHVVVGYSEEVLVVDGELELTAAHPMWVDDAWRQARDLQVDSEVIGLGGKPRPVRSVVRKAGATTVYDLSVDDPHNYYADGLLVHNKSMHIPRESTWKYNPAILRPDDLLGVVQSAHEPIVECLRPKRLGYHPHRIESFVVDFRGGVARLIVLTPTATTRHENGSRTQSFAPSAVEECVQEVFEKLAETNTYPPGVRPRFYRFRLLGEGPPVERVDELDVETMQKTFTRQGPGLAQCLDQLSARSLTFKGVPQDGGSVTFEVNFRDPSDPVSVVGLYDRAGVPYDGLQDYLRPALVDCVETAVHPSWFDGVPVECETTIRASYRFQRKAGSWDTSWELLNVGPSKSEERAYRCTSRRPGTIKLRRALEGRKPKEVGARSRPGPRKVVAKKCKNRGYTNVWAGPNRDLRCGASCDEIRDCRFVMWAGRNMSFVCGGVFAGIEVELNAHSSFVERTPFPDELPVRIRLVEQDGERWLTVRSATAQGGYEEGEILLASGNGSAVTPPGKPDFFAPLAVLGASGPQGGHVFFGDQVQSTEISHNADCHTPDGHYFIAVSHAREPGPNHAAKRFRFVLLNVRHRPR